MRQVNIPDRWEFPIHGLDIDQSPMVARKAVSQNDNISTAIFQEIESKRGKVIKAGDTDGNKGKKDEFLDDEADILAQMSNILIEEQGESAGESSLLTDLKTLKEEAWARKQARKLKKLKKVQFQDEHPIPFHRTCCCRFKQTKCNGNTNLGDKVPESNKKYGNANSQFNSLRCGGTSRKTVMSFLQIKHGYHKNYASSTNNSSRPVAKLHSIDMFRNIIPSYMFQEKPSTFRYL